MHYYFALLGFIDNYIDNLYVCNISIYVKLFTARGGKRKLCWECLPSSACTYLSAEDHRDISQSFLHISVCLCHASWAEVLWFPTRACKRSPNKDEQDVCPGYDANEEAPIRCPIIYLLTPNVNYSGRTAPLTSKVAFYIFIQQI